MQQRLDTQTENPNILKITLIISAFLSLIFLDQTGVGVILASIQKQFVLSNAMTSWILDAYLLALTVFLLLFARLSDVLGVRNLFMSGIFIFMVASIGCALATSGGFLILSRIIQGIGASLGYATYLLILNHEIPANKRGRVLGTSAAFAALFLAAGPFIGGFFSSVISWRYLFWINVPICLACLYYTTRACNKDVLSTKTLFSDKLGLMIYMVAIISSVFFLMEGSSLGWNNPVIIALILIAVISFIAFYLYENRIKNPLVDIHLFKNKAFTASILILFGNYACITTLAFWALWLEQVLGYSALLSGLALLPAGLPYVLTSRLGGSLYDRYGPRKPLMIGSILFLIGFIEIAAASLTLQYWYFFIGLILIGLGWGYVRPCAILSGLNSVTAEHKSMATGMISTMRQFGAAVGFALVFAVINTTRHHLFATIIHQHQLKVSVIQLEQALIQAGSYPSLKSYLPAIKMAYTQAFALGLTVISLLAILNLWLVFRYIKNQQS